MYSAHRLGMVGESFATDYLLRQGYRILDRNWRARDGLKGELDLVATSADRLVFVEVKTSSRSTAMAIAHITTMKERQLRALACRWRATHPQIRGRSRGDVIAIHFSLTVDTPEIVHLKGVW